MHYSARMKVLKNIGLFVLTATLTHAGTTFAQVSTGSPAPSPTSAPNIPIDVTVALSAQPTTDAPLFDESVIFAPNFAVSQKDPSLSDLFTEAGASNLCFPTAFTEDLIYLANYHQPSFPNLPLMGWSADGKSIDSNQVIRQMAAYCHTSITGTLETDAVACAFNYAHQSTYGMGATQIITPFTQPKQNMPVTQRQVTIQDIRNSLRNGDPILLDVAWFTYNAQTKQWTRSSGHFITVFGYDWNRSWGENQILVKVVNPASTYNPDRKSAIFDTVIIQRYSPQPGVVYPQNRPFILSGSGFGGSTERGFLGMLIHLSPSL
jgi:hypothetical protein